MKITDLDKNVLEGHYRRPGSPSAYDRDYASSVSGMGKHQSQAYQDDGGANDEGWGRDEWKPQEEPLRLTAIYFYNVPAGMEDEASAAGLKLTKNGKWGLKQYNKSGRTFAHQSNVASQKFGKPRIWHPTNESATAGATSAGNVAVGPVYKNKPVSQPKNKDGTAKNALEMKGVNLLTGGSLKR